MASPFESHLCSCACGGCMSPPISHRFLFAAQKQRLVAEFPVVGVCALRWTEILLRVEPCHPVQYMQLEDGYCYIFVNVCVGCLT